MDICKRMLSERQYVYSLEAERKFRDHLYYLTNVLHLNSFSNGRYVRNVIEKSIRAQAMRLLMTDQYDKRDLMTIRSDDLVFDSVE